MVKRTIYIASLLCVFTFWDLAAEKVSPLKAKFQSKKSDLARLYDAFDYQPIWLDEDGDWTNRAKNLEVAIKSCQKEGLNPEAYDKLSTLRKKKPQSEEERALIDVKVSNLFLKYAKDLLLGRLRHLNIQAKKLGNTNSFDVTGEMIRRFKSNKSGKFIQELTINTTGYQRLKDLLADYRANANNTDWPPFPKGKALKIIKLRNGEQKYPSGERVETLIKILKAQGDLDTTTSDSSPYDETVAEGVKRFQKRHMIKVDGVVGPETTRMLNLSHKNKIDKILLSMERWRWLPKNIPGRYVIVNIPGFHLTAYRNGEKEFDMNIIVGKRYRKTPTFSSEIFSVRFNPSWHVPPGIFRKDKLPKIMRDPSYVSRKGYIVYDRYSGRRLNPHHVDWGSQDIKLVQPPGNRNALGKIRFTLKTTNSVYLHGTPQQHLFKKNKRTFSSGCIRVENPYKLAVYMFNDVNEWPEDRIRKEASGRRTKNVPLKEPVPVFIVYQTVWVDDDSKAYFADDVYGRDRVLLEQIRQVHYPGYVATVSIQELFKIEAEKEPVTESEPILYQAKINQPRIIEHPRQEAVPPSMRPRWVAEPTYQPRGSYRP